MSVIKATAFITIRLVPAEFDYWSTNLSTAALFWKFARRFFTVWFGRNLINILLRQKILSVGILQENVWTSVWVVNGRRMDCHWFFSQIMFATFSVFWSFISFLRCQYLRPLSWLSVINKGVTDVQIVTTFSLSSLTWAVIFHSQLRYLIVGIMRLSHLFWADRVCRCFVDFVILFCSILRSLKEAVLVYVRMLLNSLQRADSAHIFINQRIAEHLTVALLMCDKWFAIWVSMTMLNLRNLRRLCFLVITFLNFVGYLFRRKAQLNFITIFSFFSLE